LGKRKIAFTLIFVVPHLPHLVTKTALAKGSKHAIFILRNQDLS
jgi:hypothetical protein